MSTPVRPITSPPRAVSPSATGRGVVHLDPSCTYPESACICAICTCGKHKCPDRAAHVPFDGDSTYHHDFPAHPLSARRLPPKVHVLEAGEPFTSTTSYRSDFPHHPVEARKLPPKAAREDDGIPFDATTTYVSEERARDHLGLMPIYFSTLAPLFILFLTTFKTHTPLRQFLAQGLSCP